MNLSHVSFIILHYMTTKYTVNCVNSILNNIDYANYSIIIVDNNSPNNSYVELKKIFKNNSKIVLLQTDSNVGFAKGNNIGYIYAKITLHSSFIIAANNDTTFKQNNFINEIIDLYNKYNYHLLGPDIVSIDNQHQNPYRNHIITKSEVSKWLIKRRLWTYFLKLDKLFNLSSRISFFNHIYTQRKQHNSSAIQYNALHFNVVLQGACVIYSPIYISQMDYAYYPKTYMYCEEDILAYICHLNKWRTLYSPSLRIEHAESASTQAVHNQKLDKEIFQSVNIVKSLKILKKIIVSQKF